MRKLLAFCVFLLIAPVAFGQDVPPEVAKYIHARKPYGTGTVTFTFFTIYDATLWTDAQPFSMDQPFALRLLYHHGLTTEGLVKKTLELMKDTDHVPEDKLRNYGAQLTKLWPNVKDGDSITAVNVPGKKTVFYFNGALRGAITDPDFAKPFFDIWLSDKTTEPAARKTLLAGPS